MVFLRATAKVLRALPEVAPVDGVSTTALGDWYVNKIVVDRRPLLLLVCSWTLLPIVTPARDVRNLPEMLPELVRGRLTRLGVDRSLVSAELGAMNEVAVTKTQDRSVVGIMVQFAHATPFFLARGAWGDTTLPFLEAWLAETPCRSGRRMDEVVFPDRDTPVRLASRWLAG